jgi:hypothetical protein
MPQRPGQKVRNSEADDRYSNKKRTPSESKRYATIEVPDWGKMLNCSKESIKLTKTPGDHRYFSLKRMLREQSLYKFLSFIKARPEELTSEVDVEECRFFPCLKRGGHKRFETLLSG